MICTLFGINKIKLSTFRIKKYANIFKILSWKSIHEVEETIPLKSVFGSSRYLDRLPRYKDSKCPWRLKTVQRLWMDSRVNDLHIFLGNASHVFPGIASVACLEFGLGQRDEARARGPNKRQGRRDGKRLKITFFFARRYLGNRKSYRDKSKSILKGKIPRFQRSFIRR